MKHILNFILIIFTLLMIVGLVDFFNPTNCSDFYGSHSMAQSRFERNPKKFKDLDRDKDGVACELLLT